MSDLVIDGVDVRQLTDEVLFAKLQELGFTPGPIVDTTRSVYQRKLVKILRNEDDDYHSESDGEYDVIDSPPTSFHLPSYKPPSFSSSPYSVDDLRRRPLPRSEFGWESSPVTSPFKRSASPSRLVAEPVTKSSVSMTVNIIIFLFLLIFAFLVYQNMEAVTTNPVPEG